MNQFIPLSIVPLDLQFFAENKVRYGLKNVHYAVATEAADGVLTYGAITRYPGAVSLTLDPRGETSEFFADDGIYYATTANNGYEGTYEAAEMPLSFKTDVLGDVIDEATGVAMENANAKPKIIALFFEFDGDVKARRYMLPKVTVSRPSLSSSTKTETAEPNTQELSFIAAPDHRGYPKYYTTAETNEAVYNGWYESVFQPGEVVAGA